MEMLDVCLTSLEEELQRSGREGCRSPLESSLLDLPSEEDEEPAIPTGMSPPSSPCPSEPLDASSPPQDLRMTTSVSSTPSSTLRRSSSGVFSRCASDLELSADSIRRQVRRRRTVTPFGGTLANKVTPADASSSDKRPSPVSSTPFNSVSLGLPRSTNPLFGALQAVTLETLLQMFVSKEAVDDGRRVKQLTFGRLPRCLCLHIQRSTYEGGKRGDAVVLPQFLNMDLFSYTGQIFKDKMLSGEMLLKKGEGQQPRAPPKSPPRGPRASYYRLCAVIVHLGGGVGTGHYVTYRRTRQRQRRVSGADDDEDAPVSEGVERWFMISDERVEEVDVARVLRCEAYAVFYERCERFSGILSA